MIKEEGKPLQDHGELRSTPIRISKLRRVLTIAAVKIAIHTRWVIPYAGACIGSFVMIKIGHGAHLQEAANLQYVRANTPVPVSKVHCAFVRKGRTYKVMSFFAARLCSNGG